MGKILPEIQHNCCIKRYPDGGAEILACAAAVFRERGWEAADKWEAEPRAAAAEHPDVAGNLARAKRRVRLSVAALFLLGKDGFFDDGISFEPRG